MQPQAHQPLALKYRPRNFEELVGQTLLTQSLKGALSLGRIAQAVIFSGIRGIGKTTTARIYAKALNCETPNDYSPCNQCGNCEAVNHGTHPDVLEIDGASHTGVDDVRSLRDTLSYAPLQGKYKVYIIDEVHMLSKGAFNALLKSIEEPPPKVAFVFATTELQKIPQTIQSRCQTFYLNKISLKQISDTLKSILTRENIPYDAAVLSHVARESDGSMRDALTMLDQFIAISDADLQAKNLERFIPQLNTENFFKLFRAITSRDHEAAIEIITAIGAQGIDWNKICLELIRMAHHSLLLGNTTRQDLIKNMSQQLNLNADNLKELQKIAKSMAPLELNQLIRIFSHCYKSLKGDILDKILFDNAIIEWCVDPGMPSVEQLQQAFSGESGAFTLPSSKAESSLPSSSSPSSLPSSASHTNRLEQPHRQQGETQQEMPRDADRNAAPAKSRVNKMNTFRESLHQTDKKPLPPAKNQPEEEPKKKNLIKQDTSQNTETDARAISDWASLLRFMKHSHPITARILEEAHPIAFSRTAVIAAIDSRYFSANKTNQSAVKAELTQILQENWAATCRFEWKNAKSLDSDAVPESILEKKNREKREYRQKVIEQSKQHPLVKAITQTFDTKIKSIEIKPMEIKK